MALLAITNLEVHYGRIRGTHSVSFAVEEGEVVALVGSNGAGKSSTLKAILGMVEYPVGHIEFGGESLKGRKPFEIVRRGVGYSPEGRRPFPTLTVVENLRMGGYTRSSREVEERMKEVFEYFPWLGERARQRAGSLSGGEQQMLAIARALMGRPKLFLLDEPSLGLAPIVVEKISEILVEIQKREKLAVILAEQNALWAMTVAQHAVILELGRTVADGAASELMRDPKVQSAFLGI
jgi:branched-chain amino acid transport system ATP-binding protein